MNYICSICISCLISDSEPMSALPCGHVFHRECIKAWFNTKRECPVCHSPCSRRHVVQRLFISTAEVENTLDESTYKSSSDLQTEVRALKSTIESIKANHKKELEIIKAKHKKELQDKQMEYINNIRSKEEEYSKLKKASRFLQRIKSITDIEEDMSLPSSQAYLNSLTIASKESLLLNVGVWRSKFNDVNNKHNNTLRTLQLKIDENDRLLKRIKELKRKYHSKETSAVQESNSTQEYSITQEPIIVNEDTTAQNRVIVIDSDDDSDVQEVSPKSNKATIVKPQTDEHKKTHIEMGRIQEPRTTVHYNPSPPPRPERVQSDKEDSDQDESIPKRRNNLKGKKSELNLESSSQEEYQVEEHKYSPPMPYRKRKFYDSEELTSEAQSSSSHRNIRYK